MYSGQLRFGVRGGFPDKPQIEDSSEISALNVLQVWMSTTRRESRNVHRPAVCMQLQHEFGISKLPNTYYDTNYVQRPPITSGFRYDGLIGLARRTIRTE